MKLTQFEKQIINEIIECHDDSLRPNVLGNFWENLFDAEFYINLNEPNLYVPVVPDDPASFYNDTSYKIALIIHLLDFLEREHYIIRTGFLKYGILGCKTDDWVTFNLDNELLKKLRDYAYKFIYPTSELRELVSNDYLTFAEIESKRETEQFEKQLELAEEEVAREAKRFSKQQAISKTGWGISLVALFLSIIGTAYTIYKGSQDTTHKVDLVNSCVLDTSTHAEEVSIISTNSTIKYQVIFQPVD